MLYRIISQERPNAQQEALSSPKIRRCHHRQAICGTQYHAADRCTARSPRDVTHKVAVDLPSGAPGTSAPIVNKLFLNAAGTAIWNGIPMDSDRLRGRLEIMAKDPAKPQLHFESDARARYERFDQLVAMIKRAGVEEVGFVGNQQFASWDSP
jgi:biopolymer transport protein ExbD